MVGNVTVGFCAAAFAAVAIAGAFIAIHEPVIALAALIVVALFYLAYQRLTLNHAAAYPDAAVASEENYTQIVGMRMAAQRPEVMTDHTLTIAPPPMNGGGNA